MAPKYKFVYFGAKARGELARLMFAQAGVEFEDVRVALEDWGALQPDAPFNKIPYLDVDGGKARIAESLSIARFLGRELGLSGKNSVDEAKADMICEALHDVLRVMFDLFFEKDETKKASGKEKLKTETMPRMTRNIERILKANCGGNAWLVGDSITYADLMSYHVFSTVLAKAPDALNDTPLLRAHTGRVGALPNVKAWVEKRPADIGI